MKKLIITTAIVLGLGLTSFADGKQGGGLFHRGATPEQTGTRDASGPLLPLQHGDPSNADADQVPVGSGIALLAALLNQPRFNTASGSQAPINHH